MRKIAFVLLAALIAAGCGSSNDSEKEISSSMSATTVVEETTTTEDEYVAPAAEETDTNDDQGDPAREALVVLISEVTGFELGFVNDGFSGCIVDAVVESEGGDYLAALENVYSDEDAYSMEFEVAFVSCISYLSGAELAMLAEAEDTSDEDVPVVLDFDPAPSFSTLAEGEECGNQEYGQRIMIDGFCVLADICLDDPGHEACGDPADYDWTSDSCPVSDLYGQTVRYLDSDCMPDLCIVEDPGHELCGNLHDHESEHSDEDHSSYDFVGTDCATADSDRKVTPNWPYDSGVHEGPSYQATSRIGAHDGYDRWVLEFDEGSTPPTGWDIRWTGDTIENDGGGEDVDLTAHVDGNKYLTVRLKSSTGFWRTDGEMYWGPGDLYGSDVGASNLVHVSSWGEYEGYTLWAIGVEYESDFTVGTLSDPARLVIDICH